MTESTFLMLCKNLLDNVTGITEEAYSQLCAIANDLGYTEAILYLYSADGNNGMIYMPQGVWI